MRRNVKFKHNERGQIIEALTTSVLGLIFVSKTTYEYDEQGHLAAEITWKDAKTIASVKQFLPESQSIACPEPVA